MELENDKEPGEIIKQAVELSEEELDEVVGGFDDWKQKWDGLTRLDNYPASLAANPISQVTRPVDLSAMREIGY